MITLIYKKDVTKDSIFDEEELFSKMDSNEVLINYLFESNLINIHHIEAIFDHTEIFDLCKKYNRLDLLKGLNVFIYFSDNVMFEELLKMDIIPDSMKNMDFFDEEQIKLLIKYKKYDLLKKLPSIILIDKFNSDKTLLEVLLDNGIEDFDVGSFPEEEFIRILINYKKFDILKKVKMNDLTLSHFLKLNDLNDTNLEKLLKYFMKDRDRSHITPILNQIYRTNDLDLKIKAIEIFVKLGMFDYLIPFNKKQLFNGEEGKRLIDRLKVFGKGVASFLVEEPLLHDVDVVAELGLNTDSLKLDVNKEYTRSEIKKLTKVQESKISDEFERALMQFKILLMGDNNANEEDTEMTISAFRNILRLNPDAITIVEKIIQEKRVETDKKFRYMFNQEDTASFFNPKSFIISMNREHNLPSILLHETGHFLHKAFDESRVPDGYIDLVNEIRNNPDFVRIVYEFYLEFNEKMKEVDAEVAKYMEEYDKTITPEREKRVEEFLNTEKRKLVDYWISKGRSREYIEQLLSKTYTKEEYFRQEREMFKRKINSVIINSRFGNYAQISDILDAVFEGALFNRLIRYNGKTIMRCSGHGVKYYRDRPDRMFKETIANYTGLRYTTSKEESLKKLRSILGDKFVDFIEDYYEKCILEAEPIQTKGKSK